MKSNQKQLYFVPKATKTVFFQPQRDLSHEDWKFFWIHAAELIKIGFSAKEAKLYLTLLARGGGTAAELTAASALQRPTVYSLLESLQEKGLVAKCLHGSRSFFTPEPPEQLMKNIETQASLIGEDFIVAGEDVRELNNTFPGILQNVTDLHNGTL